MESLGTDIYFAHPYSSWERPINERINRLLRKFIPKRTSMANFTDEQIRMISNDISAISRKQLGYRIPEELFQEHLDKTYRI